MHVVLLKYLCEIHYTMNDTWKTIFELEKYHESTEDNVVWESPYKNEDKPVFVHNIKLY